MTNSLSPEVKLDRRTLLSTLWLVVMLNLLTADILSLYIPGSTDSVTGLAGSTPIPVIMLGASVLIEIGIGMVLLSRLLKRSVNRWVNIIAALVMIVFVIGGGSTYPHYLFMATIEVVCLLLVIWHAWNWDRPEVASPAGKTT